MAKEYELSKKYTMPEIDNIILKTLIGKDRKELTEDELDVRIEVSPRDLYKLADMCYHFVSRSNHEA